jgi:predicted DNA-binding transcriptional regulator YafY
MADTTGRVLELLNLLQVHRYWHGPELADRLGISPRTLRRDIGRLRELGYPIESIPGLDGGYQMTPGSTLPPMVFTDTEALALAVGLRSVAHGSDPNTAEASVRALTKLSAVLPVDVRRRVDLLRHVADGPFESPRWRAEEPPIEVIAIVAQACGDVVRLRFDYQAANANGNANDRRAATSERYVEPYRLVTRGRRWYLVAFDLDRDDWRTFRLDRISAPVPARNPFTARPLPSDDLNQYLADRINELRPRHQVEFDVHLAADEVRTKLGASAVMVSVTKRRTRVTMTVDDLDWALVTMTGFDAPVTPISKLLRKHLALRHQQLGAALAR